MIVPETLVRHIETQTPSELLNDLLTLSNDTGGQDLPQPYLAKTHEALATGDWSALTFPFQQQEFISRSGYFLLIAPYTARRSGRVTTALSGLYGRVLPHEPVPDCTEHIISMFGELRQHIPQIAPVRLIAGSGMFGKESSEAFITPDGWGFPESHKGPAINDMIEQRRRFQLSGRHVIQAIFEQDTANLLCQVLADDAEAIVIQHWEYALHDVGHACGIGLSHKLAVDLLSNPWYRAVEEWRSDGVAFELASRVLSTDEAAKLIASNFCTRFGMDAHRAGGVETDTDVNAALLTLASLLQSGSLDVGPTGRLALKDPTSNGLIQSVEAMRAEAVALTRKELRLSRPEGVWSLYGTVSLPTAAIVILKSHIIMPCKGFYSDLQ